MTRIIFLHERFPFGGGETVTATVARALTETRPHDLHITIIAAHVGSPHVATDATNVGTRCCALETAQLACPWHQLRHPDGARAFIAQLQAIAPTGILVIPVDPPLGLLEAIRRDLPGWRTIFLLHGQPLWQVQGKTSLSNVKALRERLLHTYTRRYINRYRRIYDTVDRFAVLCDAYRAQLEQLLGIPPSQSRAIALYNPVQPILLKDLKSPIVLYMGRLDRAQKRIDRLLSAWARIIPDRPGWTLKIVGDGPDRSRLETISAELGITSSVQFCGYTDDPTPYYREASIMALTSEYEGWPCVLLEGMSAGVVPVAMDCCAGVAEILADGRGILTPPANIDAFARDLASLMDDTARTDAMRPACICFTHRFTPVATATAWLHLIDTLTHQSK